MTNTLRRAATVLLLAVQAGACASAGGMRPSPMPHRFLLDVPIDSARTLVGAALSQEKLPLDGGTTTGLDALSSTFVVRKGGMGEAEVRLAFRLSPDASADARASGVVLQLDATIRDLRRTLLMSAEDARSPRMTREPHPVQDNDRETLTRVRKLEDRLQLLGWSRANVP